MSTDDQPPWFCVRVKPRREADVAHQYRIRGLVHYLPVMKGRAGTAPLFPSYLFVRHGIIIIALTSSIYAIEPVRTTSRQVARLTDSAIDQVRQLEREAAGWTILPGAARPVRPGDPVRVERGPLAGMVAEVLAMQPHQRALLLLGSIGRASVSASWLSAA